MGEKNLRTLQQSAIQNSAILDSRETQELFSILQF